MSPKKRPPTEAETKLELALLHWRDTKGSVMAVSQAVTDLVRSVKLPVEKVGTGVCVCEWPPEKFLAHANKMGESPETAIGVMQLDHRCIRHGEKAQVALWGRHKEKELRPTWKQWASLGITYEVKSTSEPAPEVDLAPWSSR
jgi:hypothetical protein